MSYSCCGNEFEVDGSITNMPTGYHSFSFSYQVYVKGCSWSIFLISETVSNRIVQEYSYDGSYVYKLSHIETNLSEPFQPDNIAAAFGNSWIGQIHPAGFPFRILDPDAISLFYAYCSSCYLDSITNDMIGAILFQPNELAVGDLLSHSLVIRGDMPLRLPKTIDLFSVDHAFKTCEFNVSECTNVDRMELPLSFSLLHYFRNETNVLTQFDNHVAHIRDTCSLTTFTPYFPAKLYVLDYRFSESDVFVPAITEVVTGEWPSMFEATLQPSYGPTQLIKNHPKAFNVSRRRQHILGALLTTLFIIGLIGICFQLTKIKTKE